MIYVSSHISNNKRIADQVIALSKVGFKNIELTGGTDYYPDYVKDLKRLKNDFNLNYRLHNYFPPPEHHFVFNLASLDEEVSEASIEHAKRSISLSRELDSYKIGFHAGFFIHIASNELGTDIPTRELYNESEATDNFVENLNYLEQFAGDDFKIYIENNVVSTRNKKRYPDRNPSMLTSFKDFINLKEKVDFNFLLDVAHLKVSSNSLDLDFYQEFNSLITNTDYVHLSDNDSVEDQNKLLEEDSDVLALVKEIELINHDFTLEIYDKIDNILLSHKNLESCIT